MARSPESISGNRVLARYSHESGVISANGRRGFMEDGYRGLPTQSVRDILNGERKPFTNLLLAMGAEMSVAGNVTTFAFPSDTNGSYYYDFKPNSAHDARTRELFSPGGTKFVVTRQDSGMKAEMHSPAADGAIPLTDAIISVAEDGLGVNLRVPIRVGVERIIDIQVKGEGDNKKLLVVDKEV